MIAALYVEAGGAYFGLANVDPWDEARDARLYDGPYPVIAHPPCQLWGAMANVNYARWGGDHNRPGNDGGCFAAALDSVRRFGGVLEHPAKAANKPTLGKKEANATPLEFRDELLRLAMKAHNVELSGRTRSA